MDPYHTLGVDPQASDEQIRQAYLQAVRLYTPENNPDRFRAMASAYDSIKDEERRVQWLLQSGEVEADSPRDLMKQYAVDGMRQPLSFESMKAFLRSLA